MTKITKELLVSQGYAHVPDTNCYVTGKNGYSIIFGNEKGLGRIDYCEIFVCVDDNNSRSFKGLVQDMEQVQDILKAMKGH